MDGIIKVTPAELINAADSFQATGAQVNSLTNEMMNLVNGLNASWEGDAATAYTNQFKQLQDDMDRMFGMINEHVKDLNAMAQQYMSAEQANQELGVSLAGDVIS